jgi:hypothetical protein
MWGEFVPPIRPSEGDTMIFRTHLQRAPRRKTILILGSTPELRDLAVEEGFEEIYVADMSETMISAMSRYMRCAPSAREQWVLKSWLELPYPPGYFDVIVGDIVLHQLPPALEERFLERMSYLMKGDSIFASRFFFLDQEFLRQNVYTMVSRVLDQPLTVRQKFNLLKFQLIWRFADPENRTFNRSRSANTFNQILKDEKYRVLRVGGSAGGMLPVSSSSRNWSPPREEELLRKISIFFSVSDRGHAQDYMYAAYFPTLCLVKRAGDSGEPRLARVPSGR